MTQPPILVIAVAYNSVQEAASLCGQIAAAKDQGIDLVVVDNSAEESPRLQQLQSPNIQVMHFPDNPGFCGGARRALGMLATEHAGPMPYRAVVLCNTDLRTDWEQVVSVVRDATAHHLGTKWILAPDIVEEGRRFRANPAGFTPTASRRRQRILRSSRWAFSAYFWLSQQRRERQVNPHADSPRWTPMYRPYGAFVIFGAGYFTSGGVIHHGPLFNEEEAFARIAQHVDVPILYEPELRVDHQAGVTYKNRSDVYRQRYQWHRDAEQFYDNWHPRQVVGSMATWFADQPSDRQDL